MNKPQWPRRLKTYLVGLLPEEPVAKFTALIFAVTTAYTVVSFFQLRALSRSIEGEQRAWVMAKELTKGSDLNPPDLTAKPFPFIPGVPFAVLITTENVGRSPAIDVRTASASSVDRAPFKLESEIGPVPKKEQIGKRSVIGPAHRHFVRIPVRALTADEIADIKAGRLFLHLFGTIYYSDSFSVDRQTDFCLVHVPLAAHPNNPTLLGDAGFCEIHNSAR